MSRPLDFGDLEIAVRNVHEFLSKQMHETGIEAALKLLADELNRIQRLHDNGQWPR